MRMMNTRTVVMRFPKKEGPPKKVRQPRRLFEGVAVFLLFFGFFGDTTDIKGIILFHMILVEYKKAFLKYAPIESFSAGLELVGTEVKALRNKLGSLDGARVVVRGGEAFIVGMTIPPYQVANVHKKYDPERARRLLLTKKEIAILANAESKKGLTSIPLEVYNIKRNIKVRIAIVRGKGKADRREDLKKRDALREVGRVLKNR